MATQSPKDTVEQFLGLIGAGDIDGAVAMHADDIVVHFPGPPEELPWAGTWSGAKAAEWYAALGGALDIRQLGQHHIIAEGDKVVVTGDEVSASRKSGKEYSADWCFLFTVRDGKIASWQGYEDTHAIMSSTPY